MVIRIALIALFGFAAVQDAATIRIRSDVAGTRVTLDGKPMGEAPITLGPLAPGKYRVTLSKEGYEDFVQDVQVTAAAGARITAILKRLETPLPAFPIKVRTGHLHVAGLCIGELTLTALELHYKAENHTDEFRLPIGMMRSVSRAFNSSVGMVGGVTPNIPANMLPMRVEMPDKAYGFLVIAGDQSKAAAGDITWTTEVGAETSKLFAVVYELWQRTLKVRK